MTQSYKHHYFATLEQGIMLMLVNIRQMPHLTTHFWHLVAEEQQCGWQKGQAW